MSNTVYPEGVRAFSPRPAAPDFVKGSLVITPNDLFAWLKANESLLTEYNGKKQIRLNILEGQKGLYVTVDTFQPQQPADNWEPKKLPDNPPPTQAPPTSDGLPF